MSAGFQTMFVNNFRIIRQGPGNNLLVREALHVTVNAKGDITATVDNLSVDCKYKWVVYRREAWRRVCSPLGWTERARCYKVPTLSSL